MNPDYKYRLEMALDAGAQAGISPGAMFSPAQRQLSQMGVPVRPLHYMSVPGLFAWNFLGMSILFLGLYGLGLVIFPLVETTPRVFRAIVAKGGWPVVVTLAAGIAALTTAVIRLQAGTKRLPRWRDL